MAKALPFNPNAFIPGAVRMLPAGNRYQLAYTLSAANGDTLMSRRFHRNGPVALANLRAIFNWVNFDPNNGETTVGNGATITCALEYPIGATPIPFSYQNSASFTLTDPGHHLRSARHRASGGPVSACALSRRIPAQAEESPTVSSCIRADVFPVSEALPTGPSIWPPGADKTLSGTVTNTGGKSPAGSRLSSASPGHGRPASRRRRQHHAARRRRRAHERFRCIGRRRHLRQCRLVLASFRVAKHCAPQSRRALRAFEHLVDTRLLPPPLPSSATARLRSSHSARTGSTTAMARPS